MSGQKRAAQLLMAGVLCASLAAAKSNSPTLQIQLQDLTGRGVNPLQKGGKKASVFVFTRTDCPISNRYAPRLHQLYDKFSPQGVAFWLVYVDPHQDAKAIEKHMRQFDYRCGALRDPQHALAKLTGAEVTPEAVVFVPAKSGLRMVYRGRIDDQYVDFGVTRPAPTTHDLEDVLEAVVKGKTLPPHTTRAVGCFISDLK